MPEQTSALPRKLEIFVGATRRDLGIARQGIINAILEKGHIPSGMELWAAANPPPLGVVEKHLARCDAHILIVGGRYGSLVEETGNVSFTEWEFRQSLGKRPVLVFLCDERSLRLARKQERDRHEREKQTRKKLDQFRAELLTTKHIKEFSCTRKGFLDLQRHATLAIDELERSGELREDTGWIRADSAEARTARDIASNPFLKRELDQLRRFSTVGARVGQDVGSKKALARAFWANMQGRIRRRDYLHLFFESGSTVAYLADEFVHSALDAGESTKGWHIRTNNVLSLVYFDLHTAIDASRFPPGTPDPDDKYGAIFPNEWRHLHEPPPMRPRRLYRPEAEAVEQMRRALMSPERQLVFAAASGLDLDHEIHGFRGPHVGSHPNMLFKRALFTSGCPVVLGIGAQKLGNSFRVGTCYTVFGPDQTWADALRNYPISICVGFESITGAPADGRDHARDNLAAELRTKLRSLGLTVDYFMNDDGRSGAVMCANRVFAKLVPPD